ncbi:MAG: hypothetical protein ACK5Y8_06560 [Betaproteobacteria bacterium]
MGRDKAAKGKGRVWGDGPSFVALHDNVMRSPGMRQTGHTARSLLLDIALQYDGKNNGQLVAAQKYLKALGWRSSDVVTWALRELCAAGLLIETRKGGINRPSWFALAWQPLDWRAGMDMEAVVYERAHRGAYYRPDAPPVRPTHRRERGGVVSTPPGGAGSATIAPPGGVDTSPIAPPGGAIRAV